MSSLTHRAEMAAEHIRKEHGAGARAEIERRRAAFAGNEKALAELDEVELAMDRLDGRDATGTSA